jgi:flagellar protein FliO/FliZ
MTESLLLVIGFVVLLACLPWLVNVLKQRSGDWGRSQQAGQSRVISAVAVGPHQRVVTVEVGTDAARTVLVLGVTAQTITCLHTLPGTPVPRE